MPSVLVPVDGSENSLRAVEEACRQLADRRQWTVHLLNVQAPNHSAVVRKFLSQELIDEFYQVEGDAALKAARARLDAADIAYASHVEVGDVAQSIARCVQELHCDQIIMGTRGLGSGGIAAVSGLLMGSIATKVLHLVDVPVTMVK
jgi:nucleotide-binding universal stress UspA family protein